MLQTLSDTLRHTKRNAGSWRATLFFAYSGKIVFSPIRSQSVAQPHPPEPQLMDSCSPKSVFVLAVKVRIPLGMSDWNVERLEQIMFRSLKDHARDDLMQKVTAENAITEYFCKFVNSCVCLSCTVQPSLIVPYHVVTPHYFK